MNNYNELTKSYLSKEAMSNAFSKAIKVKNLINDNDTAVIFYDIEFLVNRITNLKSLFPNGTLHAVAAKANPLIKNLATIKEMGVGLEVASLPELYLAEKVGFTPEKIAFDSPSKKRDEIE